VLPLEFPFVRAASEPQLNKHTPGYVVGVMMTASHANVGERLRRSCRIHSLPLALFEVPCVHRSISPRGSDDLRFTKANFVSFLHARYRCPVLYLDADCVVEQHPALIDRWISAQTDFAIFNWFAEAHTEAYVPTVITVQQGGERRVTRDRFYRFSHSVDWTSESQLFCSGAVQWYRNSQAARRLLAHWQDTIERAPGRADDKCLDYAFNNLPAGGAPLRTSWLEKRYARYAWWIYERPVIDHPELPSSGEGHLPFDELAGRPRFHMESLRAHPVEYVFPKPSLIDTQSRTLFRLGEGRWVTAGSVTVPLWLSSTCKESGPAMRQLPPILV
jgi:hypothetical protein